jgi:cytochrome P450
MNSGGNQATGLENVRNFGNAVLRPMGQAARLNLRATQHARRLGHLGYVGATVTGYDPQDLDTSQFPYESFRALHAGRGVYYCPKQSTWILHKLEHVRDALRDTDRLTSAEGITRIKFSLPIIVSTDGVQHAELRKQILPAFTKGALESWQQIIDKLAEQYVAEMIANPGGDVVTTLTAPMPMLLIATMLGVPEDDIDDFRRWSEATTELLDFAPNWESLKKGARAVGGITALVNYIRKQVASGRLKEQGTVLGRLLGHRDGGDLSDAELVLVAILLLIAGNETTTNLLGCMFDTLGRNPEQYQLIRSNPDLIPMAVEEQLRFSSPLQNLYRTAVTDYTVDGVTIPAGSRVLISYAAANHDPDAFPDPHVYRADRDPRQHVAFGYGPHLCIGAALTRMETVAVLRELVTHVSDIEAIGETTWSRNSVLRGPTSLRIKLTPNRAEAPAAAAVPRN